MQENKTVDQEREEKKIDTSDLWIVPYADFMSVLMIFFLLMFAFAFNAKTDKRFEKIVTSIQEEMGGKIKKELIEKMIEEEKTNQMISKFDEIIQKQNLKNFVTVNSDAEQIKIIFKNPILFDIGKTELKPETKPVLYEIGIILKNMDNQIIVEGHTDNIPVVGGKFKSNWELSIARALEVIKYFTDTQQISPERFAAAGYGEFRPVFPNDTEENRSQNRRIEINILKKKT